MRRRRLRENRFKDELRRSLIVHSIIPAAVLMLSFVLFAYFGWYFLLVHSTEKALRVLSSGIDTLLEDHRDFLSHLAASVDIQRITADSGYAVKIHEQLYRFTAEHNRLGSFYVIDPDCKLVLSVTQDRPYTSNHLSDTFLRNVHYFKTAGADHFFYYEAGRPFPLLCMLHTVYGGKGVLCCVIPADSLFAVLGERSFFLVLTDRFGRIYGQTHDGFSGRFGKIAPAVYNNHGFIRHGGQRFYSKKTALHTAPLHLYAVKYVQDSVSLFFILLCAVIFIFAVVIISVWMSAHFIAVRKTQLIDTIVDAFKSSEAGNMNTRLDITSPVEFASIGQSYNSMIDSLQALMRTNEEQMQHTVLLNLRQLESQFHTHFLFNTLETIRFMIRIEPQKAESIIICLSQLLRYSITDTKETVALSEDINHVKNYLTILSYRFSTRLSYTITIPDDVLQCRIPKLIFQPVIENSIKYGLEEKDSIHIDISAAEKSGVLVISIEDNGPGIEPELLETITENLNAEAAGVHIGLYTVHRRLVLSFGSSYGIRMHNRIPSGASVELSMPLITAGME
ncbi:MAG: histidine kinase [Treponema sp.]